MEDLKLNKELEDEIEIDVSRLFLELRRKMKFIIIIGMLGAIAALLFTTMFINKKYASSADIYPKSNTTENGIADYNALTANSKMVNNYMAIIQGDSVLDKVTEKLQLEQYGEDFVKNAVKVSNESDTEIIKITAITEDPQLSKDIVEVTVDEFFKYVKDKMDIKNLMILNQAKVEERPVSPNKKLNMVLGAMVGVALSGGLVLLRFFLDKRLHTKDDVENYLEIPVLIEIPYYEE